MLKQSNISAYISGGWRGQGELSCGGVYIAKDCGTSGNSVISLLLSWEMRHEFYLAKRLKNKILGHVAFFIFCFRISIIYHEFSLMTT